jgi:hypothetical protein
MNFKAILGALALVAAPLTHAAFVTIDEAGMDAVFSQASFGGSNIDIRFGAVTQLVRPDLLDIQTDAKINTLFGLHAGGPKVVNFYFVDVVNACGGFNTAIVGCGEYPGNDFVVESSFVSQTTISPGNDISFNVNVLAHELGHNLFLDHRDSGNNLMNSYVSGFMNLNAAEVATIRLSPLVQQDVNGYYIQINPVLVVTSVPEPSGYVLAFAALCVGAGLRARKAHLNA